MPSVVIVSILLLSMGVSCQKLEWESSYNSSSKCSVGSLLIETDTIRLQGTATPTNIMLLDWNYVLDIQISKTGLENTFTNICRIIIADGKVCGLITPGNCLCDKSYSQVASFHVVLKALPEYSSVWLRARWDKRDGSSYVKSDILLPRMYNLSESRILINNQKSFLVSSACEVTVTNDRNSLFCCDNTTTPTWCHPKLNFRGPWLTALGNNTCIETPAYPGIFNYTLTVCGRDISGYCNMFVTDVTTPNQENITTRCKESADSDSDLVMILLLILGLALLIILGCAILVCCLYKKNKENSSTKTTQNPETSKEEVKETVEPVEETVVTEEPEESEGTVVN